MKTTILTMLIGLASSAFAMTPGKYTNNSQDVLTVTDRQTLTNEETRQVGGGESAVPYPTVCHYKQWGKITGENNATLTYRVVFTYLVSAKEEPVRDACAAYVAEANGAALLGSVQYSLKKNEFRLSE